MNRESNCFSTSSIPVVRYSTLPPMPGDAGHVQRQGVGLVVDRFGAVGQGGLARLFGIADPQAQTRCRPGPWVAAKIAGKTSPAFH